jgi:hypothetical protein
MPANLDWIGQIVRRAGSQPWFLRVSVAVGIAIVSALYLRPQPPGVAVTILAVGAILMTFDEMTATHKLLWACFAVALFCLEVRAINSEHIAQEKESRRNLRSILDDNRVKTKTILDDNQVRFSKTQNDFAAVTSETKSLSELAVLNLQKTLDATKNITGADSFAFVSPQNHDMSGVVRLAVFNAGAYTLTGVTVDIHRVTEMPWKETFINVGTIPGRSVRDLQEVISPVLGSDGMDSYWIFIYAQNGMIREMMQFKKGSVFLGRLVIGFTGNSHILLEPCQL